MGTYKQLFTRRRVLVRCSRFVLYHRYVLSRKYILFWRNSSVRGERMAPISVALQRSSVVLFSLPLPPPLSLSLSEPAASLPASHLSGTYSIDRSVGPCHGSCLLVDPRYLVSVFELVTTTLRRIPAGKSTGATRRAARRRKQRVEVSTRKNRLLRTTYILMYVSLVGYK